MLNNRPQREPNKILEGHVPITGNNQTAQCNSSIQKIAMNGTKGGGGGLPRALLDDGQGMSSSDMDISSSDDSTATVCVDERILETDDTKHTLLRPPIIETTGRIATGATTPALRKQNKAQRSTTLLCQPATSQWTVHNGKTLLPEEHWNERKNAAEDREMSPQGLALRHEAADTLTDWARFGCPTCTGRDWTLAEIEAAIARGPHQSALDPEAIANFAEEVTTKVNKGQARVVLWDDIRLNHPWKLKVSPVAAIPVSIYVDTLGNLLGSLLLLSSHAFTMTGSGVLEVMSIKRFALT